MLHEKTDVVVVGGGQAGIAASEHLTKIDMKHIVLERARTAEHWRTMRWDSLVANGPAWHDRFPNMEFKDRHQDAFVPKEEVADYLVDYAKMFNAPIREGIDVRAVTRMASSSGFLVNTSEGVIETSYVISATGAFQSPMVPPIVPDIAGIKQIHSTDYRNSSELPNGNVLIVGAGSSGAQISMDLMKTSRKIFLSVGSHDRPPRRYRNRDFCWWLGVLNLWDAEANPSSTHTTIAVSGADGGSTVDFRKLANQGLTLLGLTEGFQDGVLTFANNLSETIREGDKNYLSILDLADAYAERNGLDLPLDLEARKIGPDPQCISSPIRSVELRAENINTIIWATGFSNDYSWLQVDAFEATNAPSHKRGISSEPGVYFLGLPWQSRRGSSFIWGVWHDAKFIVDHIQKQQGYLAYKGSAERLPVEWSKK
ncbi:NAD(P)/FAD-dependent oxidoreductase [Paracoccaceae bacterium]|nr:NAD(P)/FAD-dependent oxidoreductase [Paracoccaceae bacterium]